MSSWKQILAHQMPANWAEEIDIFETQIHLKKQGKVDDKLFAETRLRRGVYGQRYDNGQRHDGISQKTLEYPRADLLKGPETLWDAPGMQRIKIPFGGMTPEQMDVLADMAEEYSDAICHVTTRQDFQLHYVHIEDTPDLMRRLAAVGITTREACGNSVRNVTGCPIAGVCREETFDITPYADACFHFLLGHPDVQDFGRKFKIAFSGCKHNACGLVTMHDMGFIAATREVDGKPKRGFEMYVGGGLGAVPYQAKQLEEFVPEEEILELSQAVARVYARLGEKRNRARARIKFLVDKLGIDEFRRLVREERKTMPRDAAWTAYLDGVSGYSETPLKAPAPLSTGVADAEFELWRATNVYRQRQPGYVVVTIALPLGDITSRQMRRLAGIARRYVGDNVRTTVEQNILLRWVAESDLPALHAELQQAGLAAPGAGTIVDVTACPGTDTCKLGIASSRGLAGELHERLAARFLDMNEAVQGLRIKVSGCFNSCGQQHLADLGFYGVSRKKGGMTVPHFRVVLGGQWDHNAASYGLAIGVVPSKRVPEFVDLITRRYLEEKRQGERFQEFIGRLGKKDLKEMLDKLSEIPPYELDRSYYSDWRDPREFTLSDITTGECAGEVVSMIDFDLQAAERLYFEAQLHFDDSRFEKADLSAYRAMLQAARGLVRTQNQDISDDPDRIVAEFRSRFVDTGLFRDKYAGGKFAEYLFRRHEDRQRRFDRDSSRYLLEESQLFIEAAHACNQRLLAEVAAKAKPPAREQTTPATA
ncbi:MAG: nitrite/sulfite reductase [Gammaproteobacteria bacterium]|nr:nitrite/sulfite reductase [Gammaproteobacteria bacterium]